LARFHSGALLAAEIEGWEMKWLSGASATRI
jgi:hypothetical protein